MKSRIFILGDVRDRIIPYLLGKKTTGERWEALTKLYQSDNHNKKMVLRDKLRETKMSILDSVTIYLTRITRVCDAMDIIRETMYDQEMVRISINGFTKPWKVFFSGIVAR